MRELMNNDNTPKALVLPVHWVFRKALRFFVIAELVNALFVFSLLGLFSLLGMQDIILDTLGFFLRAFLLLSACALIGVDGRYGPFSNARGPRGLVELLEAEVDASADKDEGLYYVIGYVRAHDKKPERLIELFLEHMALRRDEVGVRAKELLSARE